MPRDGSGVSSPPPGTGGTPDNTILSAMFNSWVADVTATFNAPWPVSLGGTGTADLAFPDGTVRVKNTTDPTKKLALDLSRLTTSTTRTLTVQDVNGTIALLENGLSGFRNKLIDGDFDVWWRGTSFTVAAGTSAYVAGHWLVNNTTDQPVVAELFALSDVHHTAIGASPTNALRIAFAAAPTSGDLFVGQRIENVRTLMGRTATVRGYIISTISGLAQITMAIAQSFGSGGSSAVTAFSGGVGALSGVFTKHNQVVSLPAQGANVIGSGSFVTLNWYCSPRAAGALYFAHMSLVEGDATAEADPFSPRHIEQEEALCSRYGQPLPAMDLLTNQDAFTAFRQTVFIPPMRVTPTVTQPSFGYSNATAGSVISGHRASIYVGAQAVASGPVQVSTTGGFLDAEL